MFEENNKIDLLNHFESLFKLDDPDGLVDEKGYKYIISLIKSDMKYTPKTLRRLSSEQLKKTKQQAKKVWQACKNEEKYRKYRFKKR